MSKVARKKPSRIVVFKSKTEFFKSLENNLRQKGYVLLETAPKACARTNPHKTPSHNF